MRQGDSAMMVDGAAWKHKVYVVYPGFILLIALGFGALNLPRLRSLTSDQMTIGTMVMQGEDPDLFRSSMLYASAENYSYYLPWYRGWLTVVYRASGDILWTYWLAMLALTLVTLFAWYALFLGLRLEPGLAFAGAVLGSLPRMSLGQTLWGAGIMETVLPRMLFAMMFPLVILVLYRNAFGWWAVLLAFFCVGLLGNLHPQSGVFATCLLGMMVLFYRRFRPVGWLLALGGGVCARIGVTPFLLLSAGWRSQLAVSPLASHPDAPFAQRLWEGVVSVSGGLAGTNLVSSLLVFGSCVAPVLLAAFFCARVEVLRKDRLLRVSVWATFAAVVFALVAEYSAQVTMFVWRGWPTTICWLRGTRFAAFFGVLAVVLCLARMGAAVTRRQWLQRAIFVGLMLAPVAASVGGLEFFSRTRFRPVAEAAAWAAKTPKGTRFLVEPYPALAFRFWSQRPVLIAYHDRGLFSVMQPEEWDEADRLQQAVGAMYVDQRWGDLLAAARARNIDYVVASPEAAAVMKPVFRAQRGPWVFVSELPDGAR